ncbi:MAG: tRNA pseudouridine(13) synthase TruD [Nitrososphaerota archaeon]|nr:tRNA pseudouridine(13) synthase TruD [Nitrososphaerota archaeon]
MTEAASVEAAVGMCVYATGGPRCSGRAKTSAEDFRVEERISALGMVEEEQPGYFPLYRVEKQGIDTMHMAAEMSRELRSRLSYGGLKDSRAAAVQYVTPTSLRSSKPGRIQREKFSAELVGWVPRPLTRSAVAGNRFVVTLRGCCDEIGERIEEAFAAARERRVPNYFGLQRFGVGGAGTHLVGRAIVKRDFEGAVKLILGESAGETSPERATGELPPLSRGQDVERAVAKEAARHPGEWVRALRAVPVRLRRLYVQAYQSYVFNRSLTLALMSGEDISSCIKGDNWASVSGGGLLTSFAKSAKEAPVGDATPLIQLAGYAYRNYGSRFDGWVEEALRAEEVSPGQFFIEEMQEASAEGGFRRPHMAMGEESWTAVGEAATLTFTLARGEYATVLLREVLKPEDPLVSGLV